MSKEIIQFDDAMFETKLDAMVRDKVEQIVNAMPDASGRRDRQRRQIRAHRRTQGVPCRPLRTQSDRQGRQAGAEGAETEGRGLRVGGDRTIPAARAERRGIIDRHVPGGRCPPGTWMTPAGCCGATACPRRRSPTSSRRCAGRLRRGASARWIRSTRTCSWTACGTSVSGAVLWRT